MSAAPSTPPTAEELDVLFKAYDVRGLDEQLRPDLVFHLGAAAAQVLGEGEGGFVVGHDMRPTSPVLARAFADGVASQGLDVTMIGLCSTDGLYFASGDLSLPGAMFTASHNPVGYNGIKLCRSEARPVALDTGLGEIRDRAAAGVPAHDGPAGELRELDILDRFAEHVRGFVDRDALRPLTIGVDAGNGMGGHVVPAVFDQLPIDVEALYFELDGTFPNHPANPLEEENLRDLQALVRDKGLPLGLAFDGDADRMFAVDEQGRPVSSSLVGAVIADRILARDPDATILHNLICSKVVKDTIEAAGGTAVRTKVGHSLIKAEMARTNAVFAVEHSGHYYFRDNYRADSGLIAALFLLEAVAAADAPLSEVVAPYDRYAGSGEINFTVADQAAAIEAVAAAWPDAPQDREDGLTVQLEDGWFNLRPSNTEPLLRLNAEGDDRAAMERIRDAVADLVKA